jgi:hypothetical protein
LAVRHISAVALNESASPGFETAPVR